VDLLIEVDLADKEYCVAGWDSEEPHSNKLGYTMLHACIREFEHTGRHKCDCGRGRGNVQGDKGIVTNLS
jgi:hypothetical protein